MRSRDRRNLPLLGHDVMLTRIASGTNRRCPVFQFLLLKCVREHMRLTQSTVVRSERASSRCASAPPRARRPSREVCASRDRCVYRTSCPFCPPSHVRQGGVPVSLPLIVPRTTPIAWWLPRAWRCLSACPYPHPTPLLPRPGLPFFRHGGARAHTRACIAAARAGGRCAGRRSRRRVGV